MNMQPYNQRKWGTLSSVTKITSTEIIHIVVQNNYNLYRRLLKPSGDYLSCQRHVSLFVYRQNYFSRKCRSTNCQSVQFPLAKEPVLSEIREDAVIIRIIFYAQYVYQTNFSYQITIFRKIMFLGIFELSKCFHCVSQYFISLLFLCYVEFGGKTLKIRHIAHSLLNINLYKMVKK